MSNIDKAFVSFRIGTPLWIREGNFNNLLSVFAEYPGLTDDMSLFTSATHAPLPLDVIRERAAVAGRRITRAREQGYKIGINHLPTIGHISENIPHSLTGDFTHITGIDGAVCLGALCPNDEQARSYIRECYAALAAADPDYIWIDDDVRLWGHTPISAGCFCDKCISIFEEESGIDRARDRLRAAFDEGSIDERLRVRKAWIDHNRETMARLFELIEKTVHGVKPKMPLGFMTGDRFFEGYDFARWAKILAGPGDVGVLWRPGGGFYSDSTTAECCMGIFENRLGGRVCVAGYYPWTFLQSIPKSSQIKSLMRWLSRDTLPGYVESFHKMNLWVREVDGGRRAAAVLNGSLDPAREAVLTLRTGSDLLSVYDMECVESIVPAGRFGWTIQAIRAAHHRSLADADAHRIEKKLTAVRP